MIIKCRKCNEIKPKSSQSGNICQNCYNEYCREYREKHAIKFSNYYKERDERNRQNPEWIERERSRTREYWVKLRHEVIMAYGGYRCNCCGETEPKFLTIDHINNDGAKHRRSMGYNSGNGRGASSTTNQWLKNNGYPQGFQILCFNCNSGKSINKGIYPHKANHYGVNHVNSEKVYKINSDFIDNSEPSRKYTEGVETISSLKQGEAHGT